MVTKEVQEQPAETSGTPRYIQVLKDELGPKFKGVTNVLDPESTVLDREDAFIVRVEVPMSIYTDGKAWAALDNVTRDTVGESRRKFKLNPENYAYRFEQKDDDRVFLVLEGGKMAGERMTGTEKVRIATDAIRLYRDMHVNAGTRLK
jgi:hypothetical protein